MLDSVTANRRSEIRRMLAEVPAGNVAEMVSALTAFSAAAEELGDADWALG